ncbi:MAG TPA: arginine deiminase-related protein [Methylocystis sp.]|nr:arginine deiminase-related protein [Methylocystis sp.]
MTASEGGRRRILMCAPDHYGVDYVINPWMAAHVGGVDHARAVAQWENLRGRLAEVAALEFVPPRPSLPDMVFTANAGLTIGARVILSRFHFGERREEERHFRDWFETHGFDVAPWPADVSFEGAGDALLQRGQEIIWCGWGFRSSERAPQLIEKIFARETAPLRLVDPRFYHLDTCLCPLGEGRLMYYTRAFDGPSQRRIASIVDEDRRIAVSEDDALAFACNAVEAQGRVFLNAASDDLQARLRAMGLAPVLTPLSEFLKSGGAAKCLTLALDES